MQKQPWAKMPAWMRSALGVFLCIHTASYCSMKMDSQIGFVAPKLVRSRVWACVPLLVMAGDEQAIDLRFAKDLTKSIRAAVDPEAVLDIVFSTLLWFNSVHATTCLYLLGRFADSGKLSRQQGNSEIMIKLIETHAQFLKEGTFDLQSVSNSALALGSLARLSPTIRMICDSLAEEAIKRLDEMKGNDLRAMTNTIYGFAKSRCRSNVINNLFDRSAHVLSTNVPLLNAQGISNSVWALSTYWDGTANSNMKIFLEAVSREATSKLVTFNDQNLANTAYGFAREGIVSVSFFSELAKAYRDILATLNGRITGQNLAKVASAFARLGIEDVPLFDSIANAATRNPAILGTMDVTELAWAFAEIGFRHDGVMEVFAKRAISSMSSMADWNVCVLPWAFKSLGYSSKYSSLLQALNFEVGQRKLTDKFVQQSHLGPIAWKRT